MADSGQIGRMILVGLWLDIGLILVGLWLIRRMMCLGLGLGLGKFRVKAGFGGTKKAV